MGVRWGVPCWFPSGADHLLSFNEPPGWGYVAADPGGDGGFLRLPTPSVKGKKAVGGEAAAPATIRDREKPFAL